MNSVLLEGINISKNFGAFAALKNVNFLLEENQIVGLIGPNGSGKTTLFNVITGIYKPDAGQIFFKKINITGWSPNKICRLGIARTFQTPRIFADLSIEKNVKVAEKFGRQHKNKTLSIKPLDYVGLAHKANKLAQETSLFERRLLEIAMALATHPDILLLDEPLSGLSPDELKVGIELITKIRSELEITVFWIEHVMEAILNNVDKIIVLNAGEKISEGIPTKIVSDEKVIEAYLGQVI